jgi:dTMP kinase
MSEQPKNETRKGYFVALDGIDGCGKTTQAKRLVDSLQAGGHPAFLVQDPGTTPVGKKLRELLLDKDLPMLPDTQALLFAAARRETVDIVKERMANDEVVVADRWTLSLLAYQGNLPGVSRTLILDLIRHCTIQPNLYLVLDVDAETAFQRRQMNQHDRFEAMPTSMILARRQTFNIYIQPDAQFTAGTRCNTINGDRLPDVVAGNIWQHMPERYQKALVPAVA